MREPTRWQIGGGGDVLGVIAPLWSEKRETAQKTKSYLNAHLLVVHR